MQPLPQRISRSQPLQLADHPSVPPQAQVRLQAHLDRLQPQFGQPRDVAGRQQLRLHIGQRLTPPQRQPRPCPLGGGTP
jgi:hypothetical protein